MCCLKEGTWRGRSEKGWSLAVGKRRNYRQCELKLCSTNCPSDRFIEEDMDYRRGKHAEIKNGAENVREGPEVLTT